MTILDCIKIILNENNQGLTAKEIYDQIIERDLYSFGAANPVNVVNSYLRRRCQGLDFPSAYREKLFRIIGYDGKREKFALLDEDVISLQEENDEIKESVNRLPEEKIKESVEKHIKAL